LSHSSRPDSLFFNAVIFHIFKMTAFK
jgi:hypothetical protein